MAKFRAFRIEPNIKKSYSDFSKPSTKKYNISMVKTINSKYGSIISYWGNIFEIDKGVIIGFIATESGGQMVGANKYKATGLMQATPTAVVECISKWNTTGTDLPQEAINEIKKKLPALLTAKTSGSLEESIINLLKNDANFSIMCGTLIIRWLLERFSSFFNGSQLNKAMVAYNAGAYSKAINKGSLGESMDSTSLAQNSLVPKESRAYLYKMLGINGFLNLIYRDKVI